MRLRRRGTKTRACAFFRIASLVCDSRSGLFRACRCRRLPPLCLPCGPLAAERRRVICIGTVTFTTWIIHSESMFTVYSVPSTATVSPASHPPSRSRRPRLRSRAACFTAHIFIVLGVGRISRARLIRPELQFHFDMRMQRMVKSFLGCLSC